MGFGFALFDTAIGRCAIAWREQIVVALQLPEVNDAVALARLAERLPGVAEGEPSGIVQRAIQEVVALLAGETVDLGFVPLDMADVPPFHRRVYELARSIPPGQTLTYGEVAARLGTPGAARAVGQALRRNPFAILVPCHRVLAAGGKVGGFTAEGGTNTKLRMLAKEGVEPGRAPSTLFAGQGVFTFDPLLATAQLCSADRKLGALIETVGPFGMGLHQAQSLFLSLAEAIVYQQLTARAAGAIFGRLQALFPRTPGDQRPSKSCVFRTKNCLAPAYPGPN